MHEDFYKVLGPDPSAEPEVIEAAYRRLARKYHPDVNKSLNADKRMKELNLAYEVLSNPDQRREYDRKRGRTASGAAQPETAKKRRGPSVSVEPARIVGETIHGNVCWSEMVIHASRSGRVVAAEPWLWVALSRFKAGDTHVAVFAQSGRVQPGVHSAVIQIEAGAARAAVEVKLTVNPAPASENPTPPPPVPPSPAQQTRAAWPRLPYGGPLCQDTAGE